MRLTEQKMAKNTLLYAVLGLLLNAFVFGVSWWPFRELQALGLHPLWTTALCFCLVTLCLIGLQRGVFHTWRNTKSLWVLALLSGITNVSFNWAVTVGDVVRVVLLFYLMPAWSLLLAWWLLNEAITPKTLMRLGLAVGGVLLVLHDPKTSLPLPQSMSDYLAILGGMSFAFTNVWIRKTQSTTPNPQLDKAQVFSLFIGTSFTSVIVALFATQQGLITPLESSAFSAAAGLGVLLFALAFWAGNAGMQYGMSRLRASTSSLIMLSEILFATLSSVALGAAVLEWRVVAGGLLICAAAVWAAWD